MSTGTLFGCDTPEDAELRADELSTDESSDDELSDDAEFRIVEALTEIDADTPVRNAVVLLGNGCTGTLVAPDLVLSVAHCGVLENEAYFTGGWSTLPSPMTVQFGPNRASPIATYSTTEVSAPPLHTGGGAHPNWLDDIVLLRLTADVPPTIAIPRPVYLDRPQPLHPIYGSSTETIFQVGYGGNPVGRNRRMMTGGNYRDWLSHPNTNPTDNDNTFIYTSDVLGPGPHGTNIENGDSGGPMLLNSEEGFLFGGLGFWGPTGAATFGPGTGGRSPIRSWLISQLPTQHSDFDVVSVTEGGCTGSGGDPVVAVTIQNNGVVSAHAWVDVFTGLQYAPSVGDLAQIYRDSGVLAPAEKKTLWFTIDNGFESGWVDVILDTTESVTELDESNNISFGNLTMPDCSFN
ncbi:MAG: trypsin-like serine protease [Nannocystaceae bacterium]|nr:trypsin-like serine protease [Nannocystaceae bacterium]